MPYVVKDKSGNIIGMHERELEIYTEWLSDDDPVVQAHKKDMDTQVNSKSQLEISDLDLIRVIEDLTELLIKKQVIAFTELPIFAQQKLGSRQKIRSDMISLKSLIADENEEGLF